nr:uncharacterized protein LOC127315742 [Lolium perenne]
MYGPGDPTKITGLPLSKKDVVRKAKDRFPTIHAERRGPCVKRALDSAASAASKKATSLLGRITKFQREGRELGHLLPYAEKWNAADMTPATCGIGKDRMPAPDPAELEEAAKALKAVEDKAARLEAERKEYDRLITQTDAHAFPTQLFRTLWPGEVVPDTFTLISDRLKGAGRRIREWQCSAARTGADSALHVACSCDLSMWTVGSFHQAHPVHYSWVPPLAGSTRRSLRLGVGLVRRGISQWKRSPPGAILGFPPPSLRQNQRIPQQTLPIRPPLSSRTTLRIPPPPVPWLLFCAGAGAPASSSAPPPPLCLLPCSTPARPSLVLPVELAAAKAAAAPPPRPPSALETTARFGAAGDFVPLLSCLVWSPWLSSSPSSSCLRPPRSSSSSPTTTRQGPPLPSSLGWPALSHPEPAEGREGHALQPPSLAPLHGAAASQVHLPVAHLSTSPLLIRDMFCIYAYELFEEMSKQAAYVLFEEMYKQAADRGGPSISLREAGAIEKHL